MISSVEALRAALRISNQLVELSDLASRGELSVANKDATLNAIKRDTETLTDWVEAAIGPTKEKRT